jgi:hypothetical protein
MRTLAAIGAILSAFALQLAAPPTKAQAPANTNTPLLADGTVNLGPVHGEKGVWELDYIENMANYVVGSTATTGGASRRSARGSVAEPQVPFLPWSAAVYDYNVRTQAKYDPESYCLPPGGPRLFTAPYPMEIIQLPDQHRAFFVFEVSHAWREIHMDGGVHNLVKNGTYFGLSMGHYENGGKTLSIDVTNFNEGTWLDFSGHPHTSLLHVVEKFTRPARDQLHYEALIDDPGAYSRPWTVAWNMKWWPDGKLDEYVCEENNRYIRTLRDDFGRLMFFGK